MASTSVAFSVLHCRAITNSDTVPSVVLESNCWIDADTLIERVVRDLVNMVSFGIGVKGGKGEKNRMDSNC